MFSQKVIRYIEEKHLFGIQDKVLVALSGGADSVALLQVLHRAGYACVAAHCNFRLRGEESERDEAFAKTLCHILKTPIRVARFDTMFYAKQHGVSIEMAARALRYEWFEQVRREEGAEVIAVAHHRDDNVETFLLNLIRGTGISGLRGMMPVNGRVVRPLLEVTRAEILGYLQALGQAYVTDSTNLEDEFTRNKLRLDVIPLLETINPSVREAIAETGRRLAGVEAIYKRAVSEACRRATVSEGRFSIPLLLRETAPQNVLFELLHPLGFNAAQLRDVFRSLTESEAGKLFYSPQYVLLRDRDLLVVQPRRPAEVEAVPALRVERRAVDAMFRPPRDPRTACLDADRLPGRLEIRRWQPGDRFVPLGMKGYKKVRDYLRDCKRSRFEKEKQYVVCAGGEIVWLVNERIDHRFRVTDDTRNVLLVQVETSAESGVEGGADIPTNGD